MSVIKKIFIILGLIIFIAFVILISREYLIKKPEKKIPLEESQTIIKTEDIIEESQKSTENLNTTSEESLEDQRKIQEISKKPILLFDFPLLFPTINYPEVYAYDPQSKTIRSYNIEEKTYQEIYKDENINYVLFPNNKNIFFIKSKSNFYLIDVIKDKKYNLPYSTQKVFFNQNIPYILVSGLTTNGYLAEFQEKEKKIIDLYILNPDIDFSNYGFLIGENLKFSFSSPLYLKKTNKDITSILPTKSYLSFISNKNDLVFVSYVDNMWKSFLINLKDNSIKKEFNFGTLKEKCSFEKILICGVPKNQNYNKLEDWYYLKKSFDDDLIIYDPENDNFQAIKIDGNFDIIQPQLTPLGIIFFNKNDAKLYLLNKDNFSF
ncbi:MAG: hypothetical protein KatS3mg095_0073 [Candidatus Parcubacteria bacterium]|nr:MAG: hypothetical protein KatS3mg095_0073 [Candidatus Parcubacteria bacterium]